MVLAFIVLLGLILGSFLAALTYRMPKGIEISKGRSFCDSCHKQLLWIDNIPVISYILLRGRCRFCHKRVSVRYPLIEITSASIFALIFLFRNVAYMSSPLSYFVLLFILAFTTLAIAIIDIENQIIPDEFIWISLLFSFVFFFAFGLEDFYSRLLVALLSALFLLFLNLVTFGKGMGLGDVKFALLPGFILGYPLSIIWLFVSFFSGAFFGVLLIVSKKAKLKQRIPFGPFLIFGFWLTVFFGNMLKELLLPYL